MKHHISGNFILKCEQFDNGFSESKVCNSYWPEKSLNTMYVYDLNLRQTGNLV